jgi:hypothetical protein
VKKLFILVFTEGTTIMHSSLEKIKDYSSYIPVKNAVKKIKTWKEKGCEISYLTSRRLRKEIKQVEDVLKKFNFPKGTLYYRKRGEEYKDVVEKLRPDIFIDDDCESIGGNDIKKLVNPKLNIKIIIVKEFEGIYHLPEEPENLLKYSD